MSAGRLGSGLTSHHTRFLVLQEKTFQGFVYGRTNESTSVRLPAILMAIL
jgi:hypothetical protein